MFFSHQNYFLFLKKRKNEKDKKGKERGEEEMDRFDDILSGIDFDENEEEGHSHTTHDDEYQEAEESYGDEEDGDFPYNIEEDAKAEEDLLRGLEAETGERPHRKYKPKDHDLLLEGYVDDEYDDDDDDDDDDDFEGNENEEINTEKAEGNPEEEENDLNPLLWSFTTKDLTGNPRDVLDQNMALQEVIRCEINKLRARINQNMKMQRNLAKVLKQGNKIRSTGKHRGFSFFPSFYKDVKKHLFFHIHYFFVISYSLRNPRRTTT